MTDSDSYLKEFGIGGLNGLMGGSFFLLSALAFGLEENITSFLTTLTETSTSVGPFELSYALMASIGIVLVSGGVNSLRSGANSDANQWAGMIMLGLLGLMALPSFDAWASDGSVGTIMFLVTVAGYSVLGGVGSGSRDSDSFISKPTEIITGGLKR